MTLPKYAKFEVERRWLVEPGAAKSLKDGRAREIEDLYLPGTGLRLRKVSEPGVQSVFKLCKKYGKSSALCEGVTNLYLSEAEYLLLRSRLVGEPIKKVRYEVAGGALDDYGASQPQAIFEVEFSSEAEAATYTPPAFVGAEVTGNPAYSGARLAARLA